MSKVEKQLNASEHIERENNDEADAFVPEKRLEKLNVHEAAKIAPDFHLSGNWLVQVGKFTFAWAPEYVYYSGKYFAGQKESLSFGENTDFVREWGITKGKPTGNPLISSDTIGSKGKWISTKTGEYVEDDDVKWGTNLDE